MCTGEVCVGGVPNKTRTLDLQYSEYKKLQVINTQVGSPRLSSRERFTETTHQMIIQITHSQSMKTEQKNRDRFRTKKIFDLIIYIYF